MPTVTRRDFLAASSLAIAGTTIGTRPLFASVPHTHPGLSSLPANALLSAPRAPTDLQRFASTAVDAARSAGSSYADVRVAERHELQVRQQLGGPLIPDISLKVSFAYGIRTLVDGAWSFAYGITPDADGIATTARNAVATARGSARTLKPEQRQVEFAAAPVVTGTWTSPIKVDPFTIPLEDQVALLWSCQQAAERLPGAAVPEGSIQFNWIRETRVMASTEGSLVTQTFYRSKPYFGVAGDRGMGFVNTRLPFVASTGGYEVVLIPDLQDQLKAAGEEMVRLSRLPQRQFDVGRYPVVFDGFTMSTVLRTTVGHALEMDRVLGYEADASGTSFLAPASEMLDTTLFSPLLNVTAGRVAPDVEAVKWDDDGVEPQTYSVIAAGRVEDYHTSRQTAPSLRSWYERQGRSIASRGCAVAPGAADPVLVRTPHLTVTPGAQSAPLDTLYKDIQHGLLIRGASWSAVSTDQQCASGSLNNALAFEIEQGKIVSRIRDAGLQFNTRTLWKSLAAIGDASTVRTNDGWAFKGQPWIPDTQSATAPAGFFKDVDVIVTGRRF